MNLCEKMLLRSSSSPLMGYPSPLLSSLPEPFSMKDLDSFESSLHDTSSSSSSSFSSSSSVASTKRLMQGCVSFPSPSSSSPRISALRRAQSETDLSGMKLTPHPPWWSTSNTPPPPSHSAEKWKKKEEAEEDVKMATFIVEDDGEAYTSYGVGANGATVICNSKGCRPLMEMEKTGSLRVRLGLGLGFGLGVGGCSPSRGHSSGRTSSIDVEAAEIHYQSLLQKDPQNPLLLCNYGQFLDEVMHDQKRAEELYQRAILISPSDGDALSSYAKLVWDVHGDRERAQAYHERAVQAEPEDCYVQASYASFLWDSEENEGEEENTPPSSYCSSTCSFSSRFEQNLPLNLSRSLPLSLPPLRGPLLASA